MADKIANRTREGLIAFSIGLFVLTAPAHVALAQELKRLVLHETVETSRCERFVAAEQFRIGQSVGGRVLSAIGFNFARLFLNGTEADSRGVTLRAWTLRYSADDVSLIKYLGGEDGALVPLCSIYRLMEKGGRGGNHIDSQSNFAFARAPAGGPVMAIHWFVNHSNEWVIGAVEVPHPHLDLPPGSRVFSPAVVKAEGASR